MLSNQACAAVRQSWAVAMAYPRLAKGEPDLAAFRRQLTHTVCGISGICQDCVPPPTIDFCPACTVIFPGHCAVKLPPSIVMLAPPDTASVTFLAAAMFTTPL